MLPRSWHVSLLNSAHPVQMDALQRAMRVRSTFANAPVLGPATVKRAEEPDFGRKMSSESVRVTSPLRVCDFLFLVSLKILVDGLRICRCFLLHLLTYLRLGFCCLAR